MRGKKFLLAKILFHSHLINLFKRLPLQRKLIILNYHRIQPDDPDFTTPFDEEVYNVTASQFFEEIKWLKEHTKIFSEEELLNTLDSKTIPSEPGILITFDDGYRENFTIAYPILKELNVPVIFFIPTNIINNREVGWWDTIAYLIKKSSRREIVYGDRGFSLRQNRRGAINFFQEKMKLEKSEQTKNLLDDLAELCAVDPPDLLLQDEQLLTWAQIKQMSQDPLIALGSHAHTHRVLATLDMATQREEMILSKFMLEEKIGKQVCSIAYPVGEPEHFTEQTQTIAKESGYRLGFTHNTRVNSWESFNPFSIKRIGGLLEDIRTVSALTVFPDMFTWERVIASQKDILKKFPDHADVHFRLGLTYLGQAQIEEAIRSFQDALKINPNYVEARIKLGLSQAYFGDFDNALENLSVIIKKYPTYADVYYFMGIVHAAGTNIQEAVSCFKRCLSINPSYKDTRLKLAILYCHTGDFSQAVKEFNEASRLDPDDMEIKAAIEVIENTVKRPDDSQDRLSEEISLIFSGDRNLNETIREFNRQIAISPTFSEMISVVISFSEENDERLEMLIPLMKDYIAQYPMYADFHNTLGNLYLKLHKLDDAEVCFRETVRLNPKYMKGRISLFKTLTARGNSQEALEQGEYIIAMKLPYPDVHCTMAQVCFSLGRHDEALYNARKALEFNARYVQAHFLAARAHEALGNRAEALKVLEELVSQSFHTDVVRKAQDEIDTLKKLL